jgi:peptidoglycan biosynthesis protein MviN/MurJ (putative lipid II flippase)
VVVNTALGILLVGPLGLPGLALAIAIAAWIEAAYLLVALGRHVPSFEPLSTLRVLVESIVASAVAAGVALAVVGGLERWLDLGTRKLGILVNTSVATAAGLAAFVVMALVLRIPELPSIVGLVSDQVRRRGRA